MTNGPSVVQQPPDALLLIDSDGRVCHVNQQSEVMFGFSRIELIGTYIETLLSEYVSDADSEHHVPLLGGPLSRHDWTVCELVACCKSGVRLPVEASLSVVAGGDQSMMIAIVREVSATRNIEDSLTDAQLQQDRQSHQSETLAAFAIDRHEDRVAVREDRLRIARDLHDRVIGRLFAAGLLLQQLLANVKPAVREQVESALEEIDHAISDLRRAVFILMLTDEHVTIAELRRLISRTLAEKECLGFDIRFESDGPDMSVTLPIVDELFEVLNLAMSNVHRHARTTEVVVQLSNDASEISLYVTDDGTTEGRKVSGALAPGR